jgi:general secretion pathway protein M
MMAAVKSGLRRLLALVGYGAAIVCLAGIGGAALADLYDRAKAVSATKEILERMDGHKKTPAGAESDAVVSGSPFLEGPTVTVAGAALQERVGAAVKKAGGNVLSSQIELQGPDAAGYVNLSDIFDIEQSSLQPLLYDLEAGMPFLFVDSLAVQTPQAMGETTGSRMRVQIGVSGQWQAIK